MAERGRGRGLLAIVVLALLGVLAFFLLRGSDSPAPTPVAPPRPALPAVAAAPKTPSNPAAPPPSEDAPPASELEADAPKPGGPGAGTLVVTVVAMPSSAPIEGAVVAVRDGTEEPKLVAQQTTGPDGVARFEKLELDEVRVDARAPGRVPGKDWVSGLHESGEHAVKLSLEPGDALGGVVLAAKDRRPLAGAKVVVEFGGDIGFMSSTYSDPELSDTIADADGRFRIDGIPRKEIVTFFASAPGYVRGRRCLMLGEGAEGHPAVELLLEEGCTAEGAVLDPDGNPVAGAWVWIWKVDGAVSEDALARFDGRIGAWGPGPGTAGETKSREDGSFRFEGLALGTPYRLAARGGPFARSRPTDPPVVADAQGQALRVDIRLRRPSVLRVKVVDPKEAAVVGATVQIDDGMTGVVEPEGGGHRFDPLIAGEYRLEVIAPGFEPAKQTVSLGEAETKEVRVDLVPVKPAPPSTPGPPGTTAPKPGKARLRIVVPAGETLPARVQVARENLKVGGGGSGTEDLKDGIVEVNYIVAGVSTRIAIYAEGYAPAVRDVELAEGEERDLGDVPLDQGAELTGTVRDVEGKPVAGARLMVDLPAYQNAVGTTGADGRFRITRLPMGELSVQVGAMGMLDGTDKFTVVAGGVTRTYTLVPAVKVKGSLKGADGKPPEGMHAVFRLQGEVPTGVSREFAAYPDDDGTFDVDVAAGAYVVEVQRNQEGGEVLLRREIAVEAKAPPRVDLTLP
jgi:protocatechuate 3,4-dioxygenase beta subunit